MDQRRSLSWGWILLAIGLVSAAYAISYLLYRGVRVGIAAPVLYAYRGREVTIELVVSP